MVSFRLNLKGAGPAQEPAAFEGIADLTAELIMKGTASMGADAVAEALDFLGARVGFSAGEESAVLSAECLSEHFPKVLEIASSCLTAPALLDDEFSKSRNIRLNGLKSVKDTRTSRAQLLPQAISAPTPLAIYPQGRKSPWRK
jgi:predicted Zn-dependent peptidase